MYITIIIVVDILTAILGGCLGTYFYRIRDREDETKLIIIGICVILPIFAILIGVTAWAILNGYDQSSYTL